MRIEWRVWTVQVAGRFALAAHPNFKVRLARGVVRGRDGRHRPVPPRGAAPRARGPRAQGLLQPRGDQAGEGRAGAGSRCGGTCSVGSGAPIAPDRRGRRRRRLTGPSAPPFPTDRAPAAGVRVPPQAARGAQAGLPTVSGVGPRPRVGRAWADGSMRWHCRPAGARHPNGAGCPSMHLLPCRLAAGTSSMRPSWRSSARCARSSSASRVREGMREGAGGWIWGHAAWADDARRTASEWPHTHARTGAWQ
jgi:hypothetical protein